MNPLTVYSALTVERCDNKKEPSKLPFALINCSKISFNLHSILVSRNWDHALGPRLPEEQMTQTETPILPNQCHLIKIK